jgi:hypothetical protein
LYLVDRRAVPGVIDVLNARIPQAGDRIGASKLLEDPRLEPDPEGGRRGRTDHQPENAADEGTAAYCGSGRLGFDEGEGLPGHVSDTVEVDLLCRAARRSCHRPPSTPFDEA